MDKIDQFPAIFINLGKAVFTYASVQTSADDTDRSIQYDGGYVYYFRLEGNWR